MRCRHKIVASPTPGRYTVTTRELFEENGRDTRNNVTYGSAFDKEFERQVRFLPCEQENDEPGSCLVKPWEVTPGRGPAVVIYSDDVLPCPECAELRIQKIQKQLEDAKKEVAELKKRLESVMRDHHCFEADGEA